MPHALGKKSIARKANEIEEETGVEPNRIELFIASRTRSDGSFVSSEASTSVDNLKQAMTENKSKPNDAFKQVFGPEHSGRVRCVGRGPTPSKYFQSSVCMDCASYSAEIREMRIYMKGLEDKLDVVADALYAIAKKNFQDEKDLQTL